MARFSRRHNFGRSVDIVAQHYGVGERTEHEEEFGGDLIVQSLALPEVKLIVPEIFTDNRGHFSETYNSRRYADAGIDAVFVQDNHSFSARKSTMRGLHFQTTPFAQAKLVRVARGSIFDVAVDIRPGSPTFGRHVSAVLSASDGKQIFLPTGFAHGLMTLEPATEVLYKVSDYYSPDHELSLLWNDPELAIDWPFSDGEVTLGMRDRAGLRFAELSSILHSAEKTP